MVDVVEDLRLKTKGSLGGAEQTCVAVGVRGYVLSLSTYCGLLST